MKENYGGIAEQFTQEETSPVVIIPVPYDETSTWIKGADKGPEAILEASANMELYDIETDSEVYQSGICTLDPVKVKGNPQKMSEAVYEITKKYIEKDKFVVTLGGEHSVSIGTIQAHAHAYQDLTILQFDAHGDLRPEYEGSKYNHACVMARARECAPIVQVGIRSISVEEKEFIEPGRVFWASLIRQDQNWKEKVIEKLTPNIYITIDLDVFDPSIMPSTGTPEPGGLLWYDVIDMLRMVNEKRNIVGFDVVELCPNKNNKAPNFLASKLVYQLLSFKFESKK